MQPPESLTQRTAEQYWITEGPNSGGIAGYLLFEGHLFAFRHDFGPIDVDRGIPVAQWLERYADRYPTIATDLKADG